MNTAAKKLFIAFTGIALLFLQPILFDRKPAQAVTAGSNPASYFYYDLKPSYFNAFDYGIQIQYYNYPFNQPPSGKTFAGLIDGYDTIAFVNSVQGLVNRNAPTLYVSHMGIDDSWLTELKGKNVWLQNATQNNLASLDALIAEFKQPKYGIMGSVVWDAAKPFTLNVAATVAGADNLVIVRKGSPMYAKITAAFPVKNDLTTQNFPSKSAGYTWLVNNYLTTRKINPILAYEKDGYPVTLMLKNKMFDFNYAIDGWQHMSLNMMIARKILVFDVAPTSRIIPVDEPNQPKGQDAATFNMLLDSARNIVGPNKMVEVWGFPSRKYKSADCTGDGKIDEGDFVVCGEWATQETISQKGGAMRGATGGDIFGVDFANGSFYQHGPSSDFIAPGAPLTPTQLVQKGYVTGNPADYTTLKLAAGKKFVMLYEGDYDFAHPIYSMTLAEPGNTWNGRSTNTIPQNLGFANDAKEYIPPLISYFNKTRNANDYFMQPDSGKGYINPGLIPAAQIPVWVRESTNANREMGYRSAWVLNGNGWKDVPANNATGIRIRQMYKTISPDGIVYNASDGYGVSIDGTLPVVGMHDLANPGTSVEIAASKLKTLVGNDQFTALRTIWMKGDYLTQVVNKANAMGANVIPVDAQTFFYLIKLKYNQYPTMRSSVISENIPSTMIANQTYTVTMKVRNDGWDTWKRQATGSCDGSATYAKGCYKLSYAIQAGEITPSGQGALPSLSYAARLDLSRDLAPGEMYDFTFTVKAPASPGSYTLQSDVVKELYGWGETFGNQPWQLKLKVVAAAPVTTTPPTPTSNCSKKTLGDANCDGLINLNDFERFRQEYTGILTTKTSDFNADAKITLIDFETWRRNFK